MAMTLTLSPRSTATTAFCSIVAVVAVVALSWPLFFAFTTIAHSNTNHNPPPFPAAPCSPQNDFHPKNCVLHKSGVYLAVTSIGHGFPHVQFTCTQAHHPQPTDSSSELTTAIPTQPTAVPDASLSPLHKQHSTSQIRVHDPADPTPEQIPHLPLDQNKKKEKSRKEEGSTIYTDLHLTPDHDHRHQNHRPAGSASTSAYPTRITDQHSLPKYDFVFSPRERSLRDPKIHTTTQIYSEDGIHPTKESVHLTRMKTGSVPPLSSPGHDDKWQIETTPEPIATLIKPTSPAARRRGEEGESDERILLSDSGKQKVGPPSPTPELLPTQVTGTFMPLQKQPSPQELDLDKSDSGRVHKVVHRVTTLIIETETIIGHPTPTAR
ncbi:hypothetical protein BGX27_001423 [Mortierella sp. AM989]|nr:hypothetical protein BGX27_001423 [Mortierella sp. AM989]